MTKMSLKSVRTLIENSEEIAGWSNKYEMGSFFWRECNLYLHKSGKWFTREYGGSEVHVDTNPKWLTREEAIAFIAVDAIDPTTGFGYTDEQAEIMVDGKDAGKGYRHFGD